MQTRLSFGLTPIITAVAAVFGLIRSGSALDEDTIRRTPFGARLPEHLVLLQLANDEVRAVPTKPAQCSTDTAFRVALSTDINAFVAALGSMEQAAAQRLAEKTTLAQVAQMAEKWKLIEAEVTAGERQKLVWELVKDVTITRADLVTVSGLLSVREEEGLVGDTGLEPVTSSV